MIEFNGEEDHIHLLFQYYPQLELPKFISNLKSISSRRLRSEFQQQVNQFYWKAVFWNESYFIASCGGVTVTILKRYIEKQDSPDLGVSGRTPSTPLALIPTLTEYSTARGFPPTS